MNVPFVAGLAGDSESHIPVLPPSVRIANGRGELFRTVERTPDGEKLISPIREKVVTFLNIRLIREIFESSGWIASEVYKNRKAFLVFFTTEQFRDFRGGFGNHSGLERISRLSIGGTFFGATRGEGGLGLSGTRDGGGREGKNLRDFQ